MSDQENPHCGCRDHVLTDYDTWQIIFDSAVSNVPATADTVTHLLFVLKEAVASGPAARLRAINTLKEGIDAAYLYTFEHKLARQLYELFLSGQLKPWDEPRQLLQGAIDRTRAGYREPKTRAQKKRKNRRAGRLPAR